MNRQPKSYEKSSWQQDLLLKAKVGAVALLATAGTAVATEALINGPETRNPYPDPLAASTEIPRGQDPCPVASGLAEETGTQMDIMSCIEATKELDATDKDHSYLRVELEQDGTVNVIPLG
ncbi:hypothetical protein B7Y94_00385 [Candidatus Saccharibacteria bacterium 32-49-12]|nr:MAG: hypothetical protein B7Y94_00385 [Candidatus Saccharibacteria bacterium 32-49-12]